MIKKIKREEKYLKTIFFLSKSFLIKKSRLIIENDRRKKTNPAPFAKYSIAPISPKSKNENLLLK